MKKSRIRELSLEMTVGAFMFMVLLALALFTIVLSSERFFKEYYPIEVLFDEVMGLREGDTVFVRGVEAGKVKELRLEANAVRVIANMEAEVRLKEDYRVEIVASSVLGGKRLQIYEGAPAAQPLAGDAEIRGVPPVDIIAEAGETIDLVRSALDEGGILNNLKETMIHVEEITRKFGDGEGTLGKLLADDKVYNDLNEITANLKDVSSRLAEGKGTLGRLLSEDDTLYQNLNEAIDAIKDVTTTISGGKGTLGKLAKDDELYNELKNLLSEARSAIDDIRETSPVTTFSSIFFGAF